MGIVGNMILETIFHLQQLHLNVLHNVEMFLQTRMKVAT